MNVSNNMLIVGFLILAVVVLIYINRERVSSYLSGEESSSFTPTKATTTKSSSKSKTKKSNFTSPTNKCPFDAQETFSKAKYIYDTERGDAHGGQLQTHDKTTPQYDYETFQAQVTLDPAARNNHSNWVKEVLPWSSGRRWLDNLDEAAEASIPFMGLRRPQAVKQSSDALMLTEFDTKTLAKNKKFLFNA